MTTLPSQAQVAAEKKRAIALPAAAAVIVFFALLYLQFSQAFGKLTLFAQFPLGVAFYFCYAWHMSLAKRANAHAEQLKKG